ncbi:MAG: hypothetical protein ABW034_24320 [Steroidobacteraceae bacterium]
MTRMIGAVSPSGRRNLRNGRVIDPESKLDAVRNVGIRGGKIVTISEQQMNGGTLIDFHGDHDDHGPGSDAGGR